MYYISFVHFFCFVTYLYMLVYILIRDPKSLLNRVCAALFLCFGIWSFSFVFIHNRYVSLQTAKMFIKISSIGGIPFVSFFLWFLLAFIGKRNLLQSKIFYLVIFGIPLILIYGQLESFAILHIDEIVKFPYGWDTTVNKTSLWTIVYYLYAYSTAITAISMLIINIKNIPESKKRIQAKFIAITSIVLLIANTIAGALSEGELINMPHINDVVYLIWSAGLLFTITKYQLFALSPSSAADKLIETMSDSLLLVDKEGIAQEVNSASLSLFKCSREELINKPLSNFFQSKEPWNVQFPDFIQKKPVHNFETQCITKTGKEVPALFSSSPKRDAEGKIKGSVCVIRDITEERRLEKEIIEIESRKQLSIGHDLHNSLGPHLREIALRCKELEEKVKAGDTVEKKEFAEITSGITQAADTIHKLSKTLSPVEMQAEGLMNALQELANSVEQMYSINCMFFCDSPIVITNEVSAMHLYRIAQEAVNNAIKHRKADHIDITLSYKRGHILLQVADNGEGNPENKRRQRETGLQTIRYRARIIGATLNIYHNDSRGTIMHCIVPQEETVRSL